ncbi:MAG: hypothetical protein EOP84_00385 [Verrucomicrobiaceae bacterium]|nr:MAG: hypothetical protein EOP84_00385 [Verrucomicrobiaceae bacterium]
MASIPVGKPAKPKQAPEAGPGSQALIRERASRELVFGVVGHVGSGTSTIAKSLEGVLNSLEFDGTKVKAVTIQARTVITDWATRRSENLPSDNDPKMENVQRYQDLGDLMRSGGDHAAVARGAIVKVREQRAAMQNVELRTDEPVVPDGNPRAYILDSIRHPAEVQLLRRVYGDGFVLIGVVCEQNERKRRLTKKYRDAGLEKAEKFMERDAKAAAKHGQRVSDAFHLADFFIDNTASRFKDEQEKVSNEDWDISDHLKRLIRVVTHEQIERPRIEETAMFAAAGAGMRSACLSRQVGAALLDAHGNIIATGANEVPRAGGGVYGEDYDNEADDDRCFRHNKYCSNTREQTRIAEKIVSELRDELKADVSIEDLVRKLKSGRVGELIEFSRAVHAEMDALLDAGRKGASTVACRLYVTTFPCHYCARHIVSAGIDEVQYIEPYPKSMAFDLHGDSILNDKSVKDWKPPSAGGKQVLFRPFTGVAPRMYRQAFQKNRALKDDQTGDMNIKAPEWGTPYDISKTSYAEFEVTLTKGFD